MKKSLYKQIVAFLIVGIIATAIDWILYYILCNIVLISPYISNILSFIIALIFNYIASSKWVFNFKNKSFVPFVIYSIIGLLLTEALLFIFIDLINIDKMISKIIATIITMIFNFLTRKVLLEKKHNKKDDL